MAILILCDPHYFNSPWCDNKIRGIQDEIVRRRDKKAKIYTDFQTFESAASKLDCNSTVIVLYDNISYIQGIAPMMARLAIHPIITYATTEVQPPFYHSTVSTDIEASIRCIVDYLNCCGKKRIANVGVNANSWSDVTRAEIFSRYVPESDRQVFYAKGDMHDCFADFLAVRDEFDAVVCPNDHVAISLIEFLKKHDAYAPSLFVISHGDTVMARLYDNGITSVTVDHYMVGKAAAEMHYNRLKYGWSSATVLLDNKLKIRGSTGNIPYNPSDEIPDASGTLPCSGQTLYCTHTDTLGAIERLLTNSDLAELKLLYCLLAGYSGEKTGEYCFLSTEAIKYRTRKICKALGEERKAEVSSVLSKYISKENLLAVIKEFEGTKDLLLN